MQQPAVSLIGDSEMSVDMKFNREVHMKASKNTKTDKSTLILEARLTLKFRIIVAAVVGCLLGAPLTRAHEHGICEHDTYTEPLKTALHASSSVR
jgi:hypothetical protein